MRLPGGRPSSSSPLVLVEWINKITSSIGRGWNIEHREDGRHKFAWVDVSPVAYGDGAMTWTSVTATVYRYSLIDRTMLITLDISGTVGGTPTDALLLELPPGYTATLPYGTGVFAYANTSNGHGVAFVIGRRLWFYQSIPGAVWTAGSVRIVGAFQCQVDTV